MSTVIAVNNQFHSTAQIIEFDEGWQRIQERGIQKLQRMISEKGRGVSFTNAEYVELYTTIYQMCIQKAPNCYTPQLYDCHQQSFKDYLESVTLPAIKQKSGEQMVKELVKRWADHKIMQRWMCDFFRYLDRFYVKRYNKALLKDVCVEQFKLLVFESVKDSTTLALLDLIKKDRIGEEVDRDLIRDAVQIFIDMGTAMSPVGPTKHVVYIEGFEAPFLRATTEFYTVEVANWVTTDSCPEYLRKAQIRFQEETQRLRDYLHSSSEPKLMACLNEAILLKHQIEVLSKQTGVRSMLEVSAGDDLTRLYSLYSRAPDSLPPIANMVKEHVVHCGTAITEKVNEEKNQEKYIEDLMALHDKYYSIVKGPLDGHPVFQKCLQSAFESIVNVGTAQSSTAELLAEFADNALKKGGMRLTPEELQTTLDNTVRLFSYLSDKDLFSEFYRKQLSKRLLLQRSTSTDSEKQMIGLLKLKCGAQFTSKMEGMITDMLGASEHEQGFVAFLKERGINSDCEFVVQTLTSGFWPTYKQEDLKLPLVMNQCIQAFEAYYATKTNNRRLRWIHKMGVVTIQANFNRRRMDLIVSAIQASILMLFNDEEELSIEALQAHTGLDADHMKNQLRSLVSGQFKVLNKKPKEGYAVNHVMSVNRDFTHPQRRIRIPNAVNKTNKVDRNNSSQTVQEDRRHAIEANIVRVMKARKTLEHAKLVSEVSAHLFQYFKPDPRDIKRRIEDLITREYLQRDETRSNVYHYLA